MIRFALMTVLVAFTSLPAVAAPNDNVAQLADALSERMYVPIEANSAEVSVPLYGAYLPLDTALSTTGERKLQTVLEMLKQHPEMAVTLVAQPTDATMDTNDPQYTDALVRGEGRAVQARKWLIKNGVDGMRVLTASDTSVSGRTLMVHFAPRTETVEATISAR